MFAPYERAPRSCLEAKIVSAGNEVNRREENLNKDRFINNVSVTSIAGAYTDPMNRKLDTREIAQWIVFFALKRVW